MGKQVLAPSLKLPPQAVSFRFRLTSDGSVGAEGWYIDDVRVQSCTATTSPDLIFRNGFE